MPNVAGKKFPYTKKGIKAASKAKDKLKGYRDGGEIQGTPKVQVSGKKCKGIF